MIYCSVVVVEVYNGNIESFRGIEVATETHCYVYVGVGPMGGR